MRAVREITGDEFTARKASLSQEKARLEALVAGATGKPDIVLDRAEKLFTLVEDAKEKFMNGTEEDRRVIFAKLGTNRTIRDKKLSIDLEKTLLPIRKLSPIVKQITERYEREMTPINTGVVEKKYLENPMLLRDQDSNLEPSPYTFPYVSKGRGLYHRHDLERS